MRSPETNTGQQHEGVFKMATGGNATRAEFPPLTIPGRKSRVKTEQPGKSGLSTATKILLVLAALGIEAGGVIRDQQIDNEPANLKNIVAQSATWPWDLGKSTIQDIGRFFGKETVSPVFDSTAETQIVKAGPGGNAKAATEKKMKEILFQQPPQIENPTNGMSAPTIEVFAPFNPEDAKSVKIEKIFDKNASQRLNYQFFDTHILISGENVPFYIPIIEGAETVKARKSITAFGISSIYFIYKLNDGQLIRGEISFWDNNYIPSANLNDIPGYNPNKLRTGTLVDASPIKEFNLLQAPLVDLFRVSGSTKISIHFGKDGLDRGFNIDPSWVTENGKLLYPASENTLAQQ